MTNSDLFPHGGMAQDGAQNAGGHPIIDVTMQNFIEEVVEGSNLML